MEVVVVKLEDDEEERPCTEISPEKKGDEQFLSNTILSIKTQTEDNRCLESNTSEDFKIEHDVNLGNIEEKKRIWKRRSTLVKEIFMRGRKRRLEETMRCKKIGIDLDVGSGFKQKLDLQLLTNGVLKEIVDFAKALSTYSQKHYIAEILEYNFDIGFENSKQRGEFAYQTLQRVVELQKCHAQKPFQLSLLNQPWMLGVKPYHTVPKTSSQKDPLRDSGIITSEHLGYAEISFESESDMMANQDIKVETFYTVSKETRANLYPLCHEIGLDLDVTYKGWSQEKLDMDVLTKGVMIEVAKYTKTLCGTYKQIVLDILEHNFDLDLQTVDSELFRRINYQMNGGRLNKKKRCQAWNERVVSLQTFRKRDHKLPPAVSRRQSERQKERQLSAADGDEKKREAVTQSAGTSERNLKERTCNFSDFERTDQYNDETADVGLMEDLGYMCSLENPGLEPSLTVLSAAGGGHVTSPAPPLTSSYDSHTALCAGKVKLQDIDMRPRLDYYPFCEQSGIDLDVHSKLESKEKHDLQFLTNGVMFEIRKYVRRNIKKKAYSYFLYDILDYNFDMSFHNEKRYFFTKRLGFDVKRLAKTYYRDMASNPNHATDVFALYSKMPKERKKKETVNQPARKSERISKEKTCQLSSFERTNPYTDGTADVGQMDDLGYMCSQENPGLEPSLTILSAAGGGHVSSPAAPLTSSHDTHTALCAGKVKLKDNNNMRARYDYYPFCEQSGIDLDVHSKVESKEKRDLLFLTNGVMFEIHKYVNRKRKKKGYLRFLYDILEYNFDMSFHNQKWPFFTTRLLSDVKRLAKKYNYVVVINPSHDTDVFALYSKIPTVRKKKETVTQPARTSGRISNEKTCKLINFERTNPYTDGTADVGQMDDLDYMCSLENPGLEPSLTILSAAGGGHVTSPAPPLTSSYDSHTALCAEEVKLEDNNNMRARLDKYPFCEQSGIDLDVHSKLESKEKHHLQFLTNGAMFEIQKYVRRNRKKKAYSYFLRDILEYNFDMSLHNQKCYFFTHRLMIDVKRLAKTYHRDVESNPHHATDVFVLHSKMPKERKKKETVNQPARTSERIFKKKTCKLSNFERTNPYTDGTADVGQMDDLGYMCSLENPGLEPLLTEQANVS